MPSTDKLKYIRYRFIFKDPDSGGTTTERSFTVFLEKETLDLVQAIREEKPTPEWTKLEYSQCGNCPLSKDDYQFCPAARSLVDVVEFFSDLPSFEQTEIIVETEQRTTSATSTVQAGLRSLMGLILPSSGCPIFHQFKPMLYTHLPFASVDETTYRVVGMYLMKQFFKKRHGGESNFDLNGLKDIYQEVHKTNVDFCARLREACEQDANLNSLVSLDVFTATVPRSIEADLSKLAPIFVDSPDAANNDESCR